jgi:hypothetical protein
VVAGKHRQGKSTENARFSRAWTIPAAWFASDCTQACRKAGRGDEGVDYSDDPAPGSVEDLRSRIWDYLYRRGEPQRLANVAEQLNETLDAIEQTVNDPWFDVQDDLVAIAHRDRRSGSTPKPVD